MKFSKTNKNNCPPVGSSMASASTAAASENGAVSGLIKHRRVAGDQILNRSREEVARAVSVEEFIQPTAPLAIKAKNWQVLVLNANDLAAQERARVIGFRELVNPSGDVGMGAVARVKPNGALRAVIPSNMTMLPILIWRWNRFARDLAQFLAENHTVGVTLNAYKGSHFGGESATTYGNSIWTTSRAILSKRAAVRDKNVIDVKINIKGMKKSAQGDGELPGNPNSKSAFTIYVGKKYERVDGEIPNDVLDLLFMTPCDKAGQRRALASGFQEMKSEDHHMVMSRIKQVLQNGVEARAAFNRDERYIPGLFQVEILNDKLNAASPGSNVVDILVLRSYDRDGHQQALAAGYHKLSTKIPGVVTESEMITLNGIVEECFYERRKWYIPGLFQLHILTLRPKAISPIAKPMKEPQSSKGRHRHPT